MKINLLIHLLSFAVAVAICTCTNVEGDTGLSDSETNVFALSLNSVRDKTGTEEAYYAHSLLHHIVIPETLPSNLDTNGNWGAATNGLQLSLRFRKKEFAVGDAVPAIAILRNLEYRSQARLLTDSPSFFLKFTVFYGTNMLPEERKRPATFPATVYTDGSSIPSPPHGFLEWTWSPRSENEVALDLRQVFDLGRPGDYTVRAACRVYSESKKSVSYQVESGWASFSIGNPANGP